MKQGKASSSGMGSTKTEPKSRAVNPGAAASIGIQEVRTRSEPLYEGRGLKAPMVGQTNHKSGSQGKH